MGVQQTSELEGKRELRVDYQKHFSINEHDLSSDSQTEPKPDSFDGKHPDKGEQQEKSQVSLFFLKNAILHCYKVGMKQN